MTSRFITAFITITALIWLASVASTSLAARHKSVIEGTVLSSDIPVVSSTVTLYSTSDSRGLKAMGRARTDANGAFTLRYTVPTDPNSVVFLTSKGGRLSSGQRVPRPFTLAVVIGPSPYAETVTLNELTTVASAFSMAQFITLAGMEGNSPGLQIASKMLRNLVDIETGEPGATITNDDNEPTTTFSALKTFNEMANLVAGCATDADFCDSILQLALPLRGPVPQNIFRAVANMAKTPWRDPEPLFDLAAPDFYQPDLGSDLPSAWTLSLKFKGDPTQLAGPGNMAFDRDGQMWIINNLVTDETYILPDCASRLLFRMDPATGMVETFTGGGILGAGYGVGIAPETNDIWVGNYGFKGSTCPLPTANDSVSQFTPDGTALSPVRGWTNGGIGWPQGTVANRTGDIWIASCNGDMISGEQVDVTIFRDGDHDNFQTITEDDFEKPFDIAFDTFGNAWVSGTLSDNIMAFSPDGTRIREYDLGSDSKPMGVASDSLGNVWVSLSGQIDLPCPPPANPTVTPTGFAMVNLDGVQINIRSDPLPGQATPPGGLTTAWGMAVDGADNIWVANFTKGGVSNFCGARPGTCPEGVETGDALSPDDTGYHSDLLDRNTAVEIDTSGNVWLANNWKDLPIKPDPAGDGMVVFIGLATPVHAPLIGTPQSSGAPYCWTVWGGWQAC